MRLFLSALSLGILCSFCVNPVAASENSLAPHADEPKSAETMESASDKASLIVTLAKQGGYGRLSQTQINMLIEARNRIRDLAAEHETFEQMDAREQNKFVHARERLNRLTQADNKSRVVCKKVIRTGTRITDAECLTVAQRESRAEGSKQRTSRLLQLTCNNTANDCSGGGLAPSERGVPDPGQQKGGK